MRAKDLPADLVVEWATKNPPPGGTLLVPDPFMDELMEHVNRIFDNETPRARKPLVVRMGQQWR